jgi:hypothetical protein
MWFFILRKLVLAPNLEDEHFDDWWAKASGRVSGSLFSSFAPGVNISVFSGIDSKQYIYEL